MKKTIIDYHKLASSKCLKWIGKSLPANTHTNTFWYCKLCNYTFQAKYHNVLYYGKGCSKCGIKRRVKASAHKIPDYHSLAESKLLIWLGSKLPENSKTKTLWKCLVCSHQWETHYNNVYQSFFSCPQCAIENNAQKKRHTASDYHNLAERMNVEWIGKLPKNSRTKTLWKCKKCNSEWMTEYSEIRSGYGCHSCANMVNGKKVSASQLKLADRIDGIVNHKVGNMWIDVAFPDRKIAIEYDSWYWHSDSQESDSQRAIDLINLGWKVLAIKANLKIPSRKKITQSITNLSPDTPYTEIVMSDWGKGSTAKQILGFN